MWEASFIFTSQFYLTSLFWSNIASHSPELNLIISTEVSNDKAINLEMTKRALNFFLITCLNHCGYIRTYKFLIVESLNY